VDRVRDLCGQRHRKAAREKPGTDGGGVGL
jgi:hypothetical protein